MRHIHKASQTIHQCNNDDDDVGGIKNEERRRRRKILLLNYEQRNLINTQKCFQCDKWQQWLEKLSREESLEIKCKAVKGQKLLTLEI